MDFDIPVGPRDNLLIILIIRVSVLTEVMTLINILGIYTHWSWGVIKVLALTLASNHIRIISL